MVAPEAAYSGHVAMGDDESGSHGSSLPAARSLEFSTTVGETGGDGAAYPSKFEISPEDMQHLRLLVERTGLVSVDVEDAMEVILNEAVDGELDKESFNSCMRVLVVSDTLDEEEVRFFSRMLSGLFYAFDRDEKACVDATELACGFAVLCAGNKSAKLAAAWGLMDDDADGLLTRRGLWRFLRSFLTALLAMSTAELTQAQLAATADHSAVWLSSHIFRVAPCDHHSDLISFDELAQWYTNGGHQVAAWLELLDLSKWVTAE